jgi:phenylalanyl-tRNA synthetase alpha chain
MTEPLYLEDSTLRSCTATITEVGETADHQTYVILDRTVMYPLGGGQPSDKGTIASKMAILTVKSVEYNGGEIKHVGISSGSLQVNDEVTVEINARERERHMQLHTAGHILDMAVRELYPNAVPIQGMHGIGRKLFVEYDGSLEVNIGTIQSKIHEIIAAGLPITTRFVTLEELKKLSSWLPAKLPTSKKLRVLSIGDSYHIPDGGTQLANTSECQSLDVTDIEILTSATRIHYRPSDLSHTAEKKSMHSQDVNSSSNTTLDQEISVVKSAFDQDIDSSSSDKELESVRVKYLSKVNGLTVKLLQELPKLTSNEKRIYGPILNKLKKSQEDLIAEAQKNLKSKILNLKSVDLTIPHNPRPSGRLHPTTIVIRELNEFFRSQGFSVQEGPEIETPEYNFRRLNLPEGHPATDLQDTLYIHEPDLLMRTHTSSIQTRILSGYKPPMRVVVPGKVYRNENKSSTNSSFFYQYQGFVVDRGVTIQNLKEMLTRVHQFLFGEDVILRYRYKYYPEVSPGMGVDMQCQFCHGTGCQVCKYRGWIETLGSGMTHYNCYKSCGIDPEVWTGYSFGMGLDRLVMNKFGINDIRKLYGGDLVYL